MRSISNTQFIAASALLLLLAGCGVASVPQPSASGAPSSGPAPSAAASPVSSPSPAASTAPSPSAASSAAASVAPSTAADAALYEAGQTIVSYYAAIRDQRYAEAYAMWAGDGAASNQTSGEFANGFEGTAGVQVQLGQLAAGGDANTVSVPVDVIAIRNDAGAPENGQRVEHFAGTYTVQRSDGAWKIAGANIAAATGALPLPGRGDALQLLLAYYEAIDGGNYGRAYTLWNESGQGSGQSLPEFAAGFDATASVAFTTGPAQANAAAGSAYADVPIVIVATTTDGSSRSYCGTYTLRRLNVPPFDQFGWRIERAAIVETAPVTLDTPAASALLSGGCASQ